MKLWRLFSLVVVFTLVASACSGSSDLALETDGDGPDVESSDFLEDDRSAETISDAPEALTFDDDTGTATSTPADVDDSDSNPETESTTPVTADSGNDAEGCEAPALNGHYVDISLDDPDGGLNVRTEPNAQSTIIATVERGRELIPTGGCEVGGSADWWEVTASDGSYTGWASSNFLSDDRILSPGVGAASTNTADVGLFAESVAELVPALANSYGFDGNVVITEVAAPEPIDAVGGSATYELTAHPSDSLDGYILDIVYNFNKDENGNLIPGVILQQVTSSPLCRVGVSPDGACLDAPG